MRNRCNEGRLYCGLPLPTISGRPVHVNGCFDLDATRIALTSDDTSLGNAKTRVNWNRLLFKHAVASAYVDALQSVPIDVTERDPAAFYTLWPAVEGTTSPMLREATVAMLSQRPRFSGARQTRVSIGAHWAKSCYFRAMPNRNWKSH
jgi:hypothetical protein